MKKLIISFIFLLCAAGTLAGQAATESSSAKANANTASRCLKLSESCLIAKDWQNAASQAETGLSYDDSISDLYYVKAAASINLGASKKAVKEIVNTAFEKDNWIDYTKNGARILYADLLCDTGCYEESLKLLDSEPLIYSADAEIIRIKNYYRIGTVESLNQARLRVNSARRIYSTDLRFPSVFFAFEALLKESAEMYFGQYKVPDLVQTIADSYILKLPDYKGDKTEIELLAALFASDDVKTRLIKAIDAKNQTKDPLLALCGMKCGLYDERTAYNLFFDYSGDSIYLIYLDYLAANLTDEDVKMELLARINNFDGTILIDENMDLQYELRVKYELGRPSAIVYDSDNDGCNELTAVCDYGAPQLVALNENALQIFYDLYPQVQKINLTESGISYNFLFEDCSYTPFAMQLDNILCSYDLEFYIPYATEQQVNFNFDALVQNCSSLELPITERENGKVIYTMLQGSPVFAKFYEGELQYAYSDFEAGIPFVRYADYDFDNYFETCETYDFLKSETDNSSVEAGSSKMLNDPVFIASIFGDVSSFSNLCLKKVQIDRNANTIFEYTQEFLSDNGTVTYWDDNDDGITDCRYTKLYSTDGENMSEETVFYDETGTEFVSVISLNTVPVKLTYNGTDKIIFAGQREGFYWIDEPGSEEEENAAFACVQNGLVQGTVEIVQSGEDRFLIIKTGNNYFCNIVKQ